MRFDDKVVVVTGAGRGIGKAIALAFAREGAKVVVCDLDDRSMQAAVDEIEQEGGTAICIRADVSNREQVVSLMRKAAETFETIHVLVNNAGIFKYEKVLDVKDENWNSTMNVDLKGVLNCIQAAAPYMVSQGQGKIVSIASVAAFAGYEGMASYAAAKAGVVQLTKVCAHEFGRHGINVNAIAPGTVLTQGSMTGRTGEQLEQYNEERKKLSCLGRAALPEDIARIILFLASEDAGFITGQTIVADGGRSNYMA